MKPKSSNLSSKAKPAYNISNPIPLYISNQVQVSPVPALVSMNNRATSTTGYNTLSGKNKADNKPGNKKHKLTKNYFFFTSRLAEVPFIGQNAEDPDDCGCWYAAVRMLGNTTGAGPRLGLPELYIPLKTNFMGICGTEEFDRVMKNEGLEKVSLPATKNFSVKDIHSMLEQYGPVMFAWTTPEGGNHISVIIGINRLRKSIIYHDPESGPNIMMPVKELNQRLYWDWPYAMLHSRDPSELPDWEAGDYPGTDEPLKFVQNTLPAQIIGVKRHFWWQTETGQLSVKRRYYDT